MKQKFNSNCCIYFTKVMFLRQNHTVLTTSHRFAMLTLKTCFNSFNNFFFFNFRHCSRHEGYGNEQFRQDACPLDAHIPIGRTTSKDKWPYVLSEGGKCNEEKLRCRGVGGRGWLLQGKLSVLRGWNLSRDLFRAVAVVVVIII